MSEITTQQKAMSIAQYAQAASLADIRRDAVAFPRITEYKHSALIREVASLVLMVYQYRGQRPESAHEVDAMTRSLVAELIADEFGVGLRNITIEEIRRALRKAALGRGPEMYGINVRSLYDAIVDYVETDIANAISQIRAAQKQEAREGYATRDDITRAYQAMMHTVGGGI